MINELKKLQLFSNISTYVLEDLIKEKQIFKRRYNKGVTVHEQHSQCAAIDVVSSGKLVAYSLSQNGSQTIVFEFKQESIIGANLLFGAENLYPMNIYCKTDSILFHVSKTGVERLLKEYDFVMQFVKSLSMNSQGMNRKISMYTQKTLRENLIDYLSELSIRQSSNIVILPITKKQLADYLGVQRPSLFRELKQMKDENLIKIENKKIIIYFLKK